MANKLSGGLDPFFQPKSVAVIGASNKKGKVGNDILLNLKKTFKGDIYPINLDEAKIEGFKAYPSILKAPKNIDLAIIAIPSQFVAAVVEECGRAGGKNLIIISAGFKEIGGQGEILEKKIKALAKKYNLRIMGPNCLGFISTAPPINASFANHAPAKGNIAFFSQSGALGAAVLDMAAAQKLGLAYFVSIGNKIDINEIDLLNYFKDEPKVKVIQAYLENINDGQEFIRLAKTVSKKKPIIILKSGKTEKGRQAVSSHTGSIAGSAQAYSAAFKQAGVIEVDEAEDFFNFAKGFSLQPLPQGNRVAIVTNAGGPGILVTDLLPANGLELAELTTETKNKLKLKLPPAASINNPIDVLGDALADHYGLAVAAVLRDKNVDAVIVVLTPQKMTQIKVTAETIGRLGRQSRKPIILCFMGEEEISKYYDIYGKYSLPQYYFPLQAVKTLAKMWEYAQHKALPIVDPKPASTQRGEPANLSIFKKKKEVAKIIRKESIVESDARELLLPLKFPLNKMKLAKSEKELVKFAKEIGYPVALKIVSSAVIHKSDVGGVKINLPNEKELLSAYREMDKKIKSKFSRAKIDGYLVGEMVKGWEIIVGMKRDPQFGPIIMVGAGGIYTEVFKDVAFRLAPLTRSDAQEMIKELKIYKLFAGARGKKPLDINSVIDLLVKLGDFSCQFPEIKEIDLNPVMVKEKGKGCSIVDVRFLK
ncbi:MAG: acetate--CoA ligase family protein [Patescibacteria group bacterium]